MDANDRAWWENYRRQRKRDLWVFLAVMALMAAALTLMVGPGLWYVLEHLSISVRWTP